MVLTSRPTADVTIGLGSSDTTEGAAAPTPLRFTSLNWNTPQTVTVTGADDILDDGDIAYTIVTTATSADTIYNGITAADVAVTNTDNDASGITVTPTAGLTTTEAGGTATFTVVLTTQPTADVTIALSSSDADRRHGQPGEPHLHDRRTGTCAQTVTVTGVDDAVDDGDVAYTILTAAATSADAIYNGLNAADVAVTNTDNDGSGITVSPTAGLTTTEAGGTATFTVVLTSQPTANVTIALSSSDTTEGTVAPASVTFTNAELERGADRDRDRRRRSPGRRQRRLHAS